MPQNIGPYLAIIVAIVAAYFTYRNQLKLKTFELLYERRKSVLIDVEGFLKNLYELQTEIECEKKKEKLEKYGREFFREGLILFHKINGANFWGSSDALAETFISVIQEPVTKNDNTLSVDEAKDWIGRTINVLSLLYAFSHKQLTNELECMAFPWYVRYFRKQKNKPNNES